MKKMQIQESDFQKVKQWTQDGFIEDDIILLDNIKEAPIPNEPRRMNFILFGLCLRGKAQYSIDTQEQLLKPGDMLIVSDRHVLDNFMASPDIEGQCIVISTKFFYEVIRDMSDLSSLMLFAKSHPVVSLTQDEIDIFLDYFQFIKRKINEKGNHFRKRVTGALLLAMFCDLSNAIYRLQQSSDQRRTRPEAIFTQFIKLVEENFRQERRVSWYAEKLCITPKYLSENVKQISKRTPNEWIDKYVVLEIRLMLKNSTKSIKEISDDLHFPNQSFLGKYFKEHVGVSPLAYRKGERVER